MPADWDRRIGALSSSSIVHIPSSLRERFALAMAQGLEDLLAGGSLERGRTKLLLAVPPHGFHLRTELETRLRMWHSGDLSALLVRLEEQARCITESRLPRASHAGGRARKLARAGAYGKAVASLTSSVAALTRDEEVDWAQELLPSSTSAAACATPPSAGAPEHPADFSKAGYAELRKTALRGVRFGALAGAGPSGMRPEHWNHALLVFCRSVSSP